jgi:amino acid transporter
VVAPGAVGTADHELVLVKLLVVSRWWWRRLVVTSEGLLRRTAGSPPPVETAAGHPIGSAAFLGVAIASLGGPLALAALYAPSILTDASASAGLVGIAAAVVFSVPLLVWLRYSGEIAGAGGLYGFVEAAAGRRVALLQAGLWIASYALYLVYTTASIVYETLPAVLPGVRPYQGLLEVAIPVMLAAVMLGGRAVTLAVLGAMAVGQLVLVGLLAAVSIGHDAPARSFALPTPSGAAATATAQIALLYVCGSLPLYLGGEVARPKRTIRRGMVIAFGLVAAGVVAAVFPLAENPAFTRAPIPGMSMAEVFSGHTLAVAIGVGTAVSIAGVMLIEYLALSRLLHVLTARSTRTVVTALAVVLVVSAPITLVNPERIYDDLLKPSLVALWLSQLVVFVVYPRFAAARRRLRVSDVALALGASAFAIYGLYATLQHTST